MKTNVNETAPAMPDGGKYEPVDAGTIDARGRKHTSYLTLLNIERQERFEERAATELARNREREQLVREHEAEMQAADAGHSHELAKVKADADARIAENAAHLKTAIELLKEFYELAENIEPEIDSRTMARKLKGACSRAQRLESAVRAKLNEAGS